MGLLGRGKERPLKLIRWYFWKMFPNSDLFSEWVLLIKTQLCMDRKFLPGFSPLPPLENFPKYTFWIILTAYPLNTLVPRSPAGHCSSADRYFQSIHGHECDRPGLGDGHREHIEDGSESDSIESIYKKLSTPKVRFFFLVWNVSVPYNVVIMLCQAK